MNPFISSTAVTDTLEKLRVTVTAVVELLLLGWTTARAVASAGSDKNLALKRDSSIAAFH